MADQWWRDAVVYQIYPRSFADASSSGEGDLRGVRSRLPYLVDLGVDAIWLTPFYPSPMHDGGYDVADYCDVDPRFGTLDDFDALVADAANVGIRLIIDIVPNHCSLQHPWFQNALRAGPGSEARERFIFRDTPNNWESHFGGQRGRGRPTTSGIFTCSTPPSRTSTGGTPMLSICLIGCCGSGWIGVSLQYGLIWPIRCLKRPNCRTCPRIQPRYHTTTSLSSTNFTGRGEQSWTLTRVTPFPALVERSLKSGLTAHMPHDHI